MTTKFKLRLFPVFNKQRCQLLQASEVVYPELNTTLVNKSTLLSDEVYTTSKILAPIFKHLGLEMGLIFLCGLLVEIGTLSLPFLSSYALKHDLSTFTSAWFCAAFLFICTGILILKSLRGYLTALLRIAIQSSLIKALTQKVIQIPFLDRRDWSSGELKNVFSGDLKQIGEAIEFQSWSGVSLILVCLLLIPYLIFFADPLCFVAISVSLFQLPLGGFIGHFMSVHQARSKPYGDKLFATAGEWLQNSRTSRMMGLDSLFCDKIQNHLYHKSKELVKGHLYACITFSLSFIWFVFPLVAMVGWAQFFNLKWSGSSIFEAFWVTQIMAEKIRLGPAIILSILQFRISLKRIQRLLQVHQISDVLDKTLDCPHFLNNSVPIRLKIENLEVKSSSEESLLSIPFFEIELDKKIAVIGKTGEGKSIFLNVILGEIITQKNSLQILFKDRITGQEEWGCLNNPQVWFFWRNYLAYVPQTPFVAGTTIYDNIEFFGSDGKQEDVLQAAYDASLIQDLKELPQGLESQLGELGLNLSGGQKQRLCLARAFYSQREFFIFDDPLSALDVNVEHFIIERLLQKKKGFILATHRLDIVKNCDFVTVIEKGRISEMGKPLDLVEQAESRLNAYLLKNNNECSV